jgi:hypothetical protein
MDSPQHSALRAVLGQRITVQVRALCVVWAGAEWTEEGGYTAGNPNRTTVLIMFKNMKLQGLLVENKDAAMLTL